MQTACTTCSRKSLGGTQVWLTPKFGWDSGNPPYTHIHATACYICGLWQDAAGTWVFACTRTRLLWPLLTQPPHHHHHRAPSFSLFFFLFLSLSRAFLSPPPPSLSLSLSNTHPYTYPHCARTHRRTPTRCARMGTDAHTVAGVAARAEYTDAPVPETAQHNVAHQSLEHGTAL